MGSDVDLVLIVSDSDRPFPERALDFDTTHLPVPADLVVYTCGEWRMLVAAGTPFARRLRDETVWVVGAEARADREPREG